MELSTFSCIFRVDGEEKKTERGAVGEGVARKSKLHMKERCKSGIWSITDY